MKNKWPSVPEDANPLSSYLEWEEAICRLARKTVLAEDIIGIWQSRPAICITAKEARLTKIDQAREHLLKSDSPVFIRKTGGTVVPQGPDFLNISYFQSRVGAKSIHDTYMAFCNKLHAALKELGMKTNTGPALGSFCDGDYNILVGSKKLIGTSQRWTKGVGERWTVLNHAVIVVSGNPLTHAERVNQFYRLATGEGEPLIQVSPENATSLEKISHSEISIEQLKLSIVKSFEIDT